MTNNKIKEKLNSIGSTLLEIAKTFNGDESLFSMSEIKEASDLVKSTISNLKEELARKDIILSQFLG